ncbi:hypothetical protein BO94DRAFT_572975 [Aspergillus sclerotioniger CBS 115572]|uniref:Uncharacterized protein n=1 Tax=Aspergillus sclerotioniger CBS 115572 TaxID=1450535 RepID=A0A317XAJ0_9EURO|nr:hypothetical protein BO94DRAFT_572975 [Aspergillus sclerotioniger CBS 115572]PWY93540.1 hypothetical protein BO94DRAFT_572975 [Aspergillus sclerotioniger CBS 115572]
MADTTSTMTTTATTAATALLPLTTIFIPPSSCINNLWLVSSSTKTWMNLGPRNTAECLPSSWEVSSYYSPGLCPSGYRIAASDTIYDGSVIETAATCCPVTGIQTYSTRNTYTPGWTELEVCTWQPGDKTILGYTYIWLGTDGSTSSTTTSMSSDGHINGYGISIRWQSTDFTTPSATTTAVSTASSTSTTDTATNTSTNSSTTSSTALPTASPSPSGLSSGAKAGIGVGVAAGAVLAIFLVLFLMRRRKAISPASQFSSQAQSYRELPATGTGATMVEQVELPAGGSTGFTAGKAELPAGINNPTTYIAELHG